MSRIADLYALEVFDSRGSPTLAVSVVTDDDKVGHALVPSGASVGTQEAVEVRDGDLAYLQGRGVQSAIQRLAQQVKPALLGRKVQHQEEIDSLLCALDGTDNKSQLGANAILGVSLATAHAAARSEGRPLYLYINDLMDNPEMTLPVPLLNVLNGGAHANNNVDIQEFMLVPSGVDDFRTAIRSAAEIFYELKDELNTRGMSTGVGDEGGFAPNLLSNQEAIELLIESINRTQWSLAENVYLALDCAATEFCQDGQYVLQTHVEALTPDQWIGELSALTTLYPAIVSIEDGLHEMDYTGWHQLTGLLGNRMQLVGDDLFVTNLALLQKGITEQLANSILVKLNQIGTLSETLAVIKLARANGFTTIISHRSGDTEDTTIADLAVGTGAGQIKSGSMSRSERVAKYNRLLQIESELTDPVYAGSLGMPWG